ncbi:ankyrin repeat domain-containing protein 13C-A-like isoform X2 [Synchiropus splendidus]|uniref:ankyrin repeat domain-containing protein 13C-A-like isoform X2 n=1 Tax=Synchiropus splendidus TaxID=270530 RepID=UPI00237EBB4C|nr:ankyrin repeat domain-containing protein 13C-A-like isoform X2 [Synchiropus splendidus]
MTGEKIRALRKEHNRSRRHDADIMDTYEDARHLKSNQAYCQRAARQQQQQQQLNADNINGNPPLLRDDNRNPVILSAAPRDFPVHQCVFQGDVRRLSSLIRSHSISQKDVHECALLLLAHNAPVKMKNAQGWSPLAEAISYGDRQMITAILRKLKQQSRESVEDKRPKLLKALRELGDFYLELHWDFQSWVPLLSRMLPSDACKIYKQGINIRLDTTLIDFSDMKCQRGDLSFVFSGDSAPSQSFVVLDNEARVYQRIHHEESEVETEEEVDILMSSDIYSATLSTKSITFSRSQVGWLFREDKTERVGNFLADFYAVNGLVLESRKRREHLSEEDILRNKAIMESLSKGGGISEHSFEPVRRQSLSAPVPNTVSWEEYISAEQGKPPHLGRELLCKESKKNFKATVAMSQDFPLGVESLLNVLEVVAPFKHFNKLREFVQMKLPPGFPVKLDIPVFPTITATVTFQEFRYDTFEDSIFHIPAEYKEDPSRFPDL